MSQFTDGAASCLLSEESKAKNLGLPIRAKIIDQEFTGVRADENIFIGPAIGIEKILRRNSLTSSQIDLFEINETCSAQVLCCLKQLAKQKPNDT